LHIPLNTSSLFFFILPTLFVSYLLGSELNYYITITLRKDADIGVYERFLSHKPVVQYQFRHY
jgi:hypothetical protein